MPGPLDDYFSKNEYLPLQSIVRRRLLAIVDAGAGQEIRRSAIEEAAHAFPIFAFNLLKYVNSPAFNLKTKVVRLKQAATLPALETLGKAIGSMPEYAPELEAQFSLSRFEEHGRVTALTTQILSGLSKKFSTLNREKLYTAAMLHDIGRLFLVLSDPAGYARLAKESGTASEAEPLSDDGHGRPSAERDRDVRRSAGLEGHDEVAVAETVSIIEAEKKYFGTDHVTLGAASLGIIGISEEDMVQAVREHHGVPAGPNVVLAYADRIVKRFGIGPSVGGSLSQDNQQDVRMKVALEETLHMTVGEAIMHVLSDIDNSLMIGMINFKNLSGGVSE